MTDKLALYLKTDQQEEQRHQPIGDPVRKRDSTDSVQRVLIDIAERAVGEDHRSDCDGEQQHIPRSCLAQKHAQGRCRRASE